MEVRDCKMEVRVKRFHGSGQKSVGPHELAEAWINEQVEDGFIYRDMNVSSGGRTIIVIVERPSHQIGRPIGLETKHRHTSSGVRLGLKSVKQRLGIK